MSGAPGVPDAGHLALAFEVRRKSLLAAYVIWFFLGFLGAHRFYLGRTGSGVAQLLLLLAGVVLSPIGIGFLLLLALGVWWLIDVVLIPGIVARHDARLLERLSAATPAYAARS